MSKKNSPNLNTFSLDSENSPIAMLIKQKTEFIWMLLAAFYSCGLTSTL